MMQEIPFQIAGLTSEEAQRRFHVFGPNEVFKEIRYSRLAEFLLRFRNSLVYILVFAAVVSAFLGDWTSSVIIIVIVLASVVLDFVNTYKSHKAAELLRQRVQIFACVFRDSRLQELPLSHIVPGDSVYLSAGDVVPADGRTVLVKNFFLNESALTGESFPVSFQTRGNCKALVCYRKFWWHGPALY